MNPVDEKNDKEKLNRRDFINKAAVVSVAGACSLVTVASFKSCFPKVLNEPPSVFKIGFPADFTVDAVEFIADKNIYVMRDSVGIRAMSAICTHLGCIVQKTGTGYRCPCHGSFFNETGNVTGGPAPKALDWYDVSMSPDGQLVVNSTLSVGKEKVFVI